MGPAESNSSHLHGKHFSNRAISPSLGTWFSIRHTLKNTYSNTQKSLHSVKPYQWMGHRSWQAHDVVGADPVSCAPLPYIIVPDVDAWIFFVIFCRLVNPNSNPCPDSLSIEHAAATQQVLRTPRTQSTRDCLVSYFLNLNSSSKASALIGIHRDNIAFDGVIP